MKNKNLKKQFTFLINFINAIKINNENKINYKNKNIKLISNCYLKKVIITI